MSRNKITRDLHSPKYRQRVVRSKKAYSRKWKVEHEDMESTLASALAFLLEQVYQMEKMFPDDTTLKEAISDAERAINEYRWRREL